MASGENILALYVQYRQQLDPKERVPFAVRKYRWAPGYYVIVHAVDTRTGEAYGVPVKNDNWVPLFIKNANWQKNYQIPDSQKPQWEFLPEIDLQHYRNHSVPGQIYELHHRLKWGKHRGLSIEELCQDQLPYVYWCIECLEDNFCLSAAAVETLAQSGIELREDILELNEEKRDWYQNGLAEEWKPYIYQLLAEGEEDSFLDPFAPNPKESVLKPRGPFFEAEEPPF